MHGNPENAWEFPLFFTIKNVKYLTDFIKRKAYLIFLNHLGIMGKRHSKYWFRIPELFLKLFRESWIFGIWIFRIQDYWNFWDWDVRDSGFLNFRILRDSRFFGNDPYFQNKNSGCRLTGLLCSKTKYWNAPYNTWYKTRNVWL